MSTLDEKLKAAGMLTVEELMKGSPLDGFMTHAGVKDLDTFEQWLKMRQKETLSLKARLTVEGKEDDELFEWALSHAAVFNEVMINFKAATSK